MYLNKPLRKTGLKSLSATFAFVSSSPLVNLYLVDGRRRRLIVPLTLDNSAPPVLLRCSCLFTWPCGSRIVVARRRRGCVWLCEIPPVGDTCISTLPSSPAAGTVASPAAKEVGAEVDGRSVFSFGGDDVTRLSPWLMSADGRGGPKLTKMLVHLLVRTPDPRMIPPPARRVPNLLTSVEPVDIGSVAGDSMTSGGGERGVPGVTFACSSSTCSENVMSSGPAVRGRSCLLTFG